MTNHHCRIGKVTPKIQLVEPIPYPINEDAVEYVERLLEDCVSGEFRSIGICAVNSRGYVHTAYSISDDENPILMQGAIAWLSARVQKKIDEESAVS